MLEDNIFVFIHFCCFKYYLLGGKKVRSLNTQIGESSRLIALQNALNPVKKVAKVPIGDESKKTKGMEEHEQIGS